MGATSDSETNQLQGQVAALERMLMDLMLQFDDGRPTSHEEADLWERVHELLGMKRCVSVRLDQAQQEFLDKFLKLKTGDPKCEDVPFMVTLDFGGGIQADIKCCNGSHDSGPYVDPVLFDNGHEVQSLEVRDTFVGLYWFTYKDQTFVASVVQWSAFRDNPRNTKLQETT